MERVTHQHRWPLLLGILLLCSATSVMAANTPCSGRKGGVAGCDGDLFLCNDGSISGSKKSCTAYLGGSRSQVARQSLQGNNDGCACGSGAFCTGPRGGVYCLTPSGKKSYRRH
ncbi:YdcA family protein [Pseudomonas defluvii]|uniref:YdcA family protein n=1 Tax=Pseudomonas defluvii TaxID=1876757 RepID=UPI00390576D6